MPYHLQSEEVTVCGETLTVWEASNSMDIKRSLLIKEADQVDGETSEGSVQEVTYAKYIRTLLYPSLVACTTGNIPTLDQFMNEMPATESDKWVDTAKRRNPRWFKFIKDEDEKEETDEKKE